MCGAERVLGADDFTFEIRGQRRMVVCEPCRESARRLENGYRYALTLNAQVAANERLLHVDMLDLDLNVIGLTI